jgi:hypothetical protein
VPVANARFQPAWTPFLNPVVEPSHARFLRPSQPHFETGGASVLQARPPPTESWDARRQPPPEAGGKRARACGLLLDALQHELAEEVAVLCLLPLALVHLAARHSGVQCNAPAGRQRPEGRQGGDTPSDSRGSSGVAAASGAALTPRRTQAAKSSRWVRARVAGVAQRPAAARRGLVRRAAAESIGITAEPNLDEHFCLVVVVRRVLLVLLAPEQTPRGPARRCRTALSWRREGGLRRECARY